MDFTIDIDTGGTFTDGFIRGDGRMELVKVDTTPHDLTLCFIECIEEASKRFGLKSAAELLVNTSTLRLATTIGTNTLIQASGPKLGLLVTRGFEENAYAAAGITNPAIDFVVPKDMIIDIDEEVDASGVSIRTPEKAQVLQSVKTLLENGARRIVVSLKGAPLNPAHEKLCKEMVLADYPAHYLGSVPLLLSTEVSSELDDLPRTNSALIDAYLHREMARYLYKADEEVSDRRYKWPLLIVHSTGGVARVAKTKAIDTCNSGPAAGLFGAAFLARSYGLENVITMDIGGTSVDIGFITCGDPHCAAEWSLSGIPVKGFLIETTSIGSGGGSIARVDEKTGQLKVGPESAGAIPGPACYGLGGINPTVTDAWVILGYIDPDYFLGGRRKLDVEQARAVIKEHVAEPLNMTVEQAAEAIAKGMNSNASRMISEFIRTKGVEPKDVTMFGFGGAGGLAGSEVARVAGIPKTYFFPFGSAFSAFGSSCMDVSHNYTVAKNLMLEPDSNKANIEEFNAAVRDMMDSAYFDMEGEGFARSKVSFVLEIVVNSEHSPSPTVIRWSSTLLKGKEDVKALLNQYQAEAGSGTTDSRVFVREIRLKASCPLTHPEFPTYTLIGESPQKALKGERAVFWDGGFQKAKIYDQKLLQSGNVVRGMAIIESVDTTILVPPNTRYLVDNYLNGVMEKE